MLPNQGIKYDTFSVNNAPNYDIMADIVYRSNWTTESCCVLFGCD